MMSAWTEAMTRKKASSLATHQSTAISIGASKGCTRVQSNTLLGLGSPEAMA